MLYPKISGPFKRYLTNRIDRTQWARPEFELLLDAPWTFTEKVDGMNMRAVWDGYTVTFGGRTDRAQIPGDLQARMARLFPEELLEQTFGVTPATLFGEGYGAGIQSGGGYGPTKDFILFDVNRAGRWLTPDEARETAWSMGIPTHANVLRSTLRQAIDFVSGGGLGSDWPGVEPEGLVGTVDGGLLTQFGERIQVKLKVKDLA